MSKCDVFRLMQFKALLRKAFLLYDLSNNSALLIYYNRARPTVKVTEIHFEGFQKLSDCIFKITMFVNFAKQTCIQLLNHQTISLGQRFSNMFLYNIEKQVFSHYAFDK